MIEPGRFAWYILWEPTVAREEITDPRLGGRSGARRQSFDLAVEVSPRLSLPAGSGR